MRERVFEILRLNTILWGVLSIFTLYKIAQLINLPKNMTIFLFTFTPIWLILSGYFKYDIALIFWILLSLFYFFHFGKNPTLRNYLIAAIPSALAICVKVSAIPLLPLYFLSYLIFKQRKYWNIISLVSGAVIFMTVILLFGMPDTLFGKGNIVDYLYDNIIRTPNNTQNFQLINPYAYLFLFHYPLIFGYGLSIVFLIAFVVWIYRLLYKYQWKKYKNETFIFCSFLIFLVSLIPLQLMSAGNRSLVLLPFLVLMVASIFKNGFVRGYLKKIMIALLIFVFLIQFFQSFAWLHMKLVISPQVQASEWLQKNISKGQMIGIENIPIYQYVPNIIQRDFYFQQYNFPDSYRYSYKLVDSQSKELPDIIIITNDWIDEHYLKNSAKRDLFRRIEKEGYTKTITFFQDFSYFKWFGREIDYYIAGIVTTPISTTVYQKEYNK